MNTVKAGVVVVALSLSSAAMAWDNGWENDNGSNKKSGRYDPIDVKGSLGSLQGSTMQVTLPAGNTSDYARLCDAVAEVKLTSRDGSMEQTEKAFIQRRIIKANRTWEAKVNFDATDAGNQGSFRFVKDSTRFETSCLRYELGGDVDPVQNRDQRPTQTPAQVCDPDTDAKGCDNTCYGQGSAACDATAQTPGSGTGWDANAQYWK